MTNKIYFMFLFIIIFFSCCKKPIIEKTNSVPYETGKFREYNWNTSIENIKDELGEPKLIQTYKQYGNDVVYYQYGHTIEFGYNTFYWFTFIENKLVGGGYTIISPNDENIKNIKYHDEAYIDLQTKFNKIYGDPTTTLEFMDDALKHRQNIPDMNKTSTQELIDMCPFVTYWANIEEKTSIKLSLYYDEDWILNIDIFGPKLIELFDQELSELLNKILEEYK
jgi:hypothetical protein